MQTFLEQIEKDLAEYADMMMIECPIDTQVSKKGTVIGILPIELRPLFGLLVDLSAEYNSHLHFQNMAYDKLITIEILFWTSVRQALPDCYSYTNLSFCEDWQIVGLNEKNEPKHKSDFFGKILRRRS